jgi:hypothetical protein
MMPHRGRVVCAIFGRVLLAVERPRPPLVVGSAPVRFVRLFQFSQML